MSGMAEVLAAHELAIDYAEYFACTCGTIQDTVNGQHHEHQAAMLTAAGFGPVKGEKRLMQLAALMAYDAVEDNVKREAAAKALEEAADAIEPRMMQFFKVAQDLNDPQRAWLRARAAAVRGEG